MGQYKLWIYGLPHGWCSFVPGHHGRSGGKRYRSREYNSWHAMVTRCYIPDRQHNEQYSTNGVKVAHRWMGENGFLHFLEDMGARPEGTSLDRINVDGDYTPSNCRWANAITQRHNQHRVHASSHHKKVS